MIFLPVPFWPGVVEPVNVPSMGKIDLFRNHSNSIESWAQANLLNNYEKKKKKKNRKVIRLYSERDSLTAWYELTLGVLRCP